MTICLQIAAFVLVFASYTNSLAETEEVPIRINEPDWPPFFYRKERGSSKTGIGKDIFEICLTRMHKTIEYFPLPIERMQNDMRSGDLDINIFSYKKDREEFVIFGKELLYSTGYRPIVKAESSLVIHSIKDFDALNLGHTIGLRYSSEFLKYIESRKKNGTLDETPTIESNLLKLLAGRIDIFVADYSSVLALAADLGLMEKIKVLDFPIHDGRYFLALSKKSIRIPRPQEFAKEFDSCIRDLKITGKFCPIIQKYKIPCPQDFQLLKR